MPLKSREAVRKSPAAFRQAIDLAVLKSDPVVVSFIAAIGASSQT